MRVRNKSEAFRSVTAHLAFSPFIRFLRPCIQAKLDALVAEQASSTVKREPKCGAGSPSPIHDGQAVSNVIDLTLED
jgi:hypothetical protein